MRILPVFRAALLALLSLNISGHLAGRSQTKTKTGQPQGQPPSNSNDRAPTCASAKARRVVTPFPMFYDSKINAKHRDELDQISEAWMKRPGAYDSVAVLAFLFGAIKAQMGRGMSARQTVEAFRGALAEGKKLPRKRKRRR